MIDSKIKHAITVDDVMGGVWTVIINWPDENKYFYGL
jgi:hypothetical protein